jgi:hypothetical protein
MAKIIGNPTITFPSEQEIVQGGTNENLHNLKRKVQELQQSLSNDKIPGQNQSALDRSVNAEAPSAKFS